MWSTLRVTGYFTGGSGSSRPALRVGSAVSGMVVSVTGRWFGRVLRSVGAVARQALAAASTSTTGKAALMVMVWRSVICCGYTVSVMLIARAVMLSVVEASLPGK